MHLPDAGICFLDNVIAYKADVVFLDWFITDFMECSYKTIQYIDTILYKFSKIHCACVFLFFPEQRDDGLQEKNAFYEFCKKELKRRNVYFIDLATALKTKDLSPIR